MLKTILAAAAALTMLSAAPAAAQRGPDRVEQEVRRQTVVRHHRSDRTYYGNRGYGHAHRYHHRNAGRNYNHPHSRHHRRYR